MKIITRQQLGGFVARFDTDSKFAKLGKTREAAIGNLVIASKERLGIKKIVWDRKDTWTRNYLQGKSNRRNFPKPDIDPKQLPQVQTPAEARILKIDDLPIRGRFRMVLRFILPFSSDHTLGHLTEYTEEQLKLMASRHASCRYLGVKNLSLLKKLLHHYGLSLRESDKPRSGWTLPGLIEED